MQRPEGSIPVTPGSYQFRDVQGRVIYVGKAINLRSRVSSYFADPKTLHPRTASMMSFADKVEWIEVRNEVEALLLEYALIKEHKPRFNIRLQDDKSFPFMAITMDEEWPRAMMFRGKRRKGVRYFGPYVHPGAIRDTLELLLRTFPVRTCAASKFKQHERLGRPCLLFHIEKCSGPCVGEVSSVDYKAHVDGLVSDDEISAQIEAIVFSEVNPALSAHGGFVTFSGHDKEGTAYFTMGGGCHGCSMSRQTMLEGVQTMLVEQVPAITRVRDITDHSTGANPYYS